MYSTGYRVGKKGTTKMWTCEYKVTWPETVTITGAGSTKTGASRVAAVKVLQWLHNLGKLKNGQPIIFDSKDVKDMLNKPTPIVVEPETIGYVKELLDTYNAEIKDIIANSHDTHKPQEITMSSDYTIDPVGRSNDHSYTGVNVDRRNTELHNRLEHRRIRDSQELPIVEYKNEIIKEIEKNRVLLIKGDTGCGKTTQVPQYIMDSFAARGAATECNMIISQPRRISAISLAERIAQERNEHIGDVVGYQVRLVF